MLWNTYIERATAGRAWLEWFNCFKTCDLKVNTCRVVDKKNNLILQSGRHYLVKTCWKVIRKWQEHWECYVRVSQNVSDALTWFRDKETQFSRVEFKICWTEYVGLKVVDLMTNMENMLACIATGNKVLVYHATKKVEGLALPFLCPYFDGQTLYTTIQDPLGKLVGRAR